MSDGDKIFKMSSEVSRNTGDIDNLKKWLTKESKLNRENQKEILEAIIAIKETFSECRLENEKKINGNTNNIDGLKVIEKSNRNQQGSDRKLAVIAGVKYGGFGSIIYFVLRLGEELLKNQM